MGYNMVVADQDRNPGGPSSSLGAKVAELRKAQRMSQSELAKKAGISRISVYRLEADQANPELATLEGIAKALGVHVSSLTTEVQSSSTKELLSYFLGSPWAKVASLSQEDLAWLESIPSVFWSGWEPTDEAIFHIIEAYRASKKARKQT